MNTFCQAMSGTLQGRKSRQAPKLALLAERANRGEALTGDANGGALGVQEPH